MQAAEARAARSGADGGWRATAEHAVSDAQTRPQSRRAIYVAVLLFYGVYTVVGSLLELGLPRPDVHIPFNVTTNVVAVLASLGVSFGLDARRARTGRDSWGWVLALALSAAVLTGAACALLTIWPFAAMGLGSNDYELAESTQALVIYLLWSLVHLSVRGGERAVEQERRISAMRQGVLADENASLLYRLDPAFVDQALDKVAEELRAGGRETAGQTVVRLAAHMRATLSLRAGEAPVDAPHALEAVAGAGGLDGGEVRRRFVLWSILGWAALLAIAAGVGMAMGRNLLAFLGQLGLQPVLGALWCLQTDRILRRRTRGGLVRMYLEAAGLCLLGLCLTTAALYVTTAAAGQARSFPFSQLPALEFLYMAPALLAWSAGWLVVDARGREIARLRSAAEIREAALKARNAMLRQQLNPHFLFNVLNALHVLILDGEPERALGAIDAIRRFVERAGDHGEDDFVPLSAELAAQDVYLDIERVRFGERLKVERRVSAELGAAKVPRLILQPLVENAVKYGVSRTPRPVRVEIAAARDGAELVLTVEDSGAPDASPQPPGLGVGLKNVEGRLKSLYGDAAALVCRPLTPAGFLAEVRIPFEL